MKIDFVLTSCNNNNSYLQMYPYIFKVWKKRMELDCYLILIMDKIPEFLIEYKDYIILFPPYNNINTVFIAQTIRILYPALFENKNILITDMDIIPISKKYFIDSIENYDDKNDIFISYTDRYLKQKMMAMCYNIAKSETWKKIFNINNTNDIKNILNEWYNINYNGEKNCDGWYCDQIKLYEYAINNKNINLVILKDKNIGYKRLDKRKSIIDKLIVNKNIMNEILDYSDIHISKRMWNCKAYNKIINDIVNKLIE